MTHDSASLFDQLLVSQDGVVDEIDLDHAESDSASGAVIANGIIVIKQSQLGEIQTAIEHSSIDMIRRSAEWTSRSVKARLGFDVHSIQSDTFHIGNNGDASLMAKFAFYPWENADGLAVENPLSALLERYKGRLRIACGRLFIRPPDRHALSAVEIHRAKELGSLEINGAHVLSDGGVLLPVHPHERYPLRYDLMNEFNVIDALAGSGRGTIDSIQPRIQENLVIAPHSYGIGSTRCSLLEHRGVLENQMIELHTKNRSSLLLHGSSRVWDNGKTTGINQPRHLEVKNRSDQPIDATKYGVKLSLYPAPQADGVTASVMGHSFNKVRHQGLSIDQYLQSDPSHAQRFRDILTTLEERADLAGFLLGANGIHEIRQERHAVQQDQAMVASTKRYLREGVQPTPGQYQDLCNYMRNMSDPRQRAILFAKQTPSSEKIRELMDCGVRSIVTSNIAQNESDMYVSDSLLQHYRELEKKGLNLYLITPKIIRKMWKNFFVDVHSLEKMQDIDVRFCIYCASATGADRLLELAEYPQFIDAIKRDFPHAAIITGAAKNGAMHYANLIARDRGIVTIGVANHIAGQETTEDELDAGTFFDEDGFSPRQGLMSRCSAIPIIGPGAQGSEFEGALERVHAKIAKSQLAPVSYIDPIGLGADRSHLWSPVMQLEHQYTETTDIPGGIPVQLTRSPYVANMTVLEQSYLQTYEKVIRPFMDDPAAFWSKCGVPDEIVRKAMSRTLRDADYTGLQVPPYLKPVIQRLGL